MPCRTFDENSLYCSGQKHSYLVDILCLLEQKKKKKKKHAIQQEKLNCPVEIDICDFILIVLEYYLVDFVQSKLPLFPVEIPKQS